MRTEPSSWALPWVVALVLVIAATACSSQAAPTERTEKSLSEPQSASTTSATVGSRPSGTSGARPSRGQAQELKLLAWQAPTLLNPHLGPGLKDSNAAHPVLEPSPPIRTRRSVAYARSPAPA